MLVQVTSDDIRLGTQCSPDHCPLALAMNHLGFKNVEVSATDIWDKDSWTLWRLPIEAQNFIQNFDGDLAVEPISFDLPHAEVVAPPRTRTRLVA